MFKMISVPCFRLADLTNLPADVVNLALSYPFVLGDFVEPTADESTSNGKANSPYKSGNLPPIEEMRSARFWVPIISQDRDVKAILTKSPSRAYSPYSSEIESVCKLTTDLVKIGVSRDAFTSPSPGFLGASILSRLFEVQSLVEDGDYKVRNVVSVSKIMALLGIEDADIWQKQVQVANSIKQTTSFGDYKREALGLVSESMAAAGVNNPNLWRGLVQLETWDRTPSSKNLTKVIVSMATVRVPCLDIWENVVLRTGRIEPYNVDIIVAAAKGMAVTGITDSRCWGRIVTETGSLRYHVNRRYCQTSIVEGLTELHMSNPALWRELTRIAAIPVDFSNEDDFGDDISHYRPSTQTQIREAMAAGNNDRDFYLNLYREEAAYQELRDKSDDFIRIAKALVKVGADDCELWVQLSDAATESIQDRDILLITLRGILEEMAAATKNLSAELALIRSGLPGVQ